MSRKNRTQFRRVYKEKNFTIVSNEIIKRADLSWKARAILIYVLSLPDDWNINLNEVMRHSTDGEASFRSGWKELTDAGYVKRQPVRDKESKKITHWETIIFESVDMTTSNPHSENLHVGNQDVGNLHVGNRKLQSTNSTKYLNKQSTNNTKEIVEQSSQSDKSDDVPYKEIIDHLNEKADRQFRHTTGKTQRLIKARINEGFELDDFKQVIDVKVAEWKDSTKMNKYLKPDTLFSPKFEGYLNQPVTNTGKERDWGEWEFV